MGTADGCAPYTGDNASGIRVRTTTAVQVIQHQCSQLTDRSANSYVFTQSTAANRLFAQKQDGTSPGGNTWSGVAAYWNPNDTASKFASCTEAGLRATLNGSWTFHCTVKSQGTRTGACKLLETTGSVPIEVGLSTANKVFITIGTTLTAAVALDSSEHTIDVTFDSVTANAAIYVDGLVTDAPAALTPGGARGTTAVYCGARVAAVRRWGINGAVMTAGEILRAYLRAV
jgi:hypothetical protein